jgi:predicted  nucleic acid-binding Zn-ribbon protein
MVDIIEMKQRVAATEEKLKSANAKGEQHSKRLVNLLQAVETNLLQNQNEIKALRAERAAAEDEIQQLKNMLQATLNLTETSSESRPSLPDRDLQGLFKRLNEIVANANRDFDELSGEPETPAPDDRIRTAKPKKKPRGKGLRKIFS